MAHTFRISSAKFGWSANLKKFMPGIEFTVRNVMIFPKRMKFGAVLPKLLADGQ